MLTNMNLGSKKCLERAPLTLKSVITKGELYISFSTWLLVYYLLLVITKLVGFIHAVTTLFSVDVPSDFVSMWQ